MIFIPFFNGLIWQLHIFTLLNQFLHTKSSNKQKSTPLRFFASVNMHSNSFGIKVNNNPLTILQQD